MSLIPAGFSGALFAQAIQITSPVDGSVVHSGRTLTVAVKADPSAFQSIALVAGGNDLGGGTPPKTVPPYQFSIPIRPGAESGHYPIAAIGVPTAGGDPVFSAGIEVDIERPDSPQQLQNERGSVNFSYGGEKLPLAVIGTFADGSQVRLNRSTYTRYSSDTPSVATVDAEGWVTSVAPGHAKITITYGNASIGTTSAQVPVYVQVPIEVNPLASSLYVSQSEKFAATVSMDYRLNQSVMWSIKPALGSIDQTGFYTAPSAVTGRQSVTVTATSVADPTKSGSAVVWILPRPDRKQ